MSRVLQAKSSNKLQSRVLLDELGINYPQLKHYLGQPASGIVHSSVCERAMYEYLKRDSLSCDEKLILGKCFVGSATEEVLTTSTTVEATSSAEEILKAKGPEDGSRRIRRPELGTNYFQLGGEFFQSS